MNPIICIAGPTASGKTALAVALAKELNGEVVSCDSMQVYRRMDIGTAKPTVEEMQGIVHHMIDVAEPDEDFSVSRYCEMAAPIVDDILARGKTAIVAGGTGLYMDSLIRGNAFAPFPATGVREALEAQADREGMETMLAQLQGSESYGPWRSIWKREKPLRSTTGRPRPFPPDTHRSGWAWILRTEPPFTAALTAGWTVCWKPD